VTSATELAGVVGGFDRIGRNGVLGTPNADDRTTKLKNLLRRPGNVNPAVGSGDSMPQFRQWTIQEVFKLGPNPRQQQTTAEGDLNRRLQELNIPVAAGLPPYILLRGTASADDCSRAEKAMRRATSDASYVGMWGEALYSGRDLNNATDSGLLDDKTASVANAIFEYNHSCLRPLSALKADSTLAKTTTLVLGVLLQKRDGWAVQCSATRVAASQVLTAKHCFYLPGTMTVASNVQI
jgi:hypothetical protein